MNNLAPHKKKNFLSKILSTYHENKILELEKSRLEAFLTAFPGEYCGWSHDGSVAYSQEFCRMLDLAHITTLTDIQNRLGPGDAAALEGLFERLKSDGVPFILNATRYDEKRVFKISGSQGQDLNKEHRFYVLWLEDITEHERAHAEFTQENAAQALETQKLKAALDHVPRPLWLRDAQGNLIWCNDTYADFLSKEKQKILEEQREIFGQTRKKKGQTPNETLPGKPMAAKAKSENKPQETRVHNIIKGSRMLLNITEIPLADFDITLGIAYNVTREEDLEVQIKRYQSSNRELLEQLRTAIATFGSDQKLEFYNSAFSQLWGLEGGWLNKKPKLSEILEKLRESRRLPEQADFRNFKQFWLGMFTSLIDPHEDMMYLPDGSALRILVVPHSMGGLMMTFEDVTSRLELESSYNTLIAVQRETLDNLDEGVAVYGGDGRLKLYNPAFMRFWNLNPEDLEGDPHITKIVAKKKPFFKKEEWGKREEELVAKGLDRLMHDGRFNLVDERLIEYTTVPLPDGGVLITYRDITDTMRVENALRDKNAALETAEHLKMDFLANVSYQLRTPLNAIMGFNEILGQEYFGPLNERQKQYTDDMKKASERLLNLINDILDLSTLEAGYMTLERTDVDIYHMLESVFGLVSEWARKKKIETKIKCPKKIGTITVDERRLQQAVINLIRNAITFTPNDGKIEIGAKKVEGGIQIYVKDTGVGISEKDMTKVFSPFERAQSGQMGLQINKGAGLGLSLVKNIVALHGGTVDIQSPQNKGTTVTLFLPSTSVETDLKLPVKKKSNKS